VDRECQVGVTASVRVTGAFRFLEPLKGAAIKTGSRNFHGPRRFQVVEFPDLCLRSARCRPPRIKTRSRNRPWYRLAI